MWPYDRYAGNHIKNIEFETITTSELIKLHAAIVLLELARRYKVNTYLY